MMDTPTRQFQAFLVKLHYEPDTISHTMHHYAEHLLHLLPVDDETMLCDYFGLFGHQQRALNDIASEHHISPETCIERIDNNLHRLAITPEWQLMQKAKP